MTVSPSDPKNLRHNMLEETQGKLNGWARHQWGNNGNFLGYYCNHKANSYGIHLGANDQKSETVLNFTRNVVGDYSAGWADLPSGRTRAYTGSLAATLRVHTRSGHNLDNHKFIGPDGENLSTGGQGGQAKWGYWVMQNTGSKPTSESNGAKRFGMAGVDGGQGAYSTADGSVKQADDAQWTSALKAAAEAKGDEFPQYGNISSPGHW